MTHLMLMKPVGNKPEHVEMYTQDLSFCENGDYFPSFVQIRAFHTSLYLYFSDTSSCDSKPLSCPFDW